MVLDLSVPLAPVTGCAHGLSAASGGSGTSRWAWIASSQATAKLVAEIQCWCSSSRTAVVLLAMRRALMAKRPRRVSVCDVIAADASGQGATTQNDHEPHGAMARLEALIAPVVDGEPVRSALAALAREIGGTLTWLDSRNGSIALTTGALAVQVLLELRPGAELGVLLSSREGMGSGAPLSCAVLDQLLAGLQAAVPGARVLFRSDRDGPIRQPAAA